MDRSHTLVSPPRRDQHASASGSRQQVAADGERTIAAAVSSSVLSLSPFASTADRVILSSPSPLTATIAPPLYRTPLPPRPNFLLFPCCHRKRDLGGSRRAATIEAEYEAQVSTKMVLPVETELTFAQRLRYAKLIIHPIRAIKGRHLRALLLYFLLLLPFLVALFGLSALLSCSTSPDLVVPLCALWAVGSGFGLYVLYLGGAGPFGCGLLEEEQIGGGTIVQVHKLLPARFSSAIAIALAIVWTQALVFTMLASVEFNTLCQLRDTISVNEAATFSTLLLQNDASKSTASYSNGLALRVNDGSARSDSSSTRGFLAFRDGFIETGLVSGLNLSDSESGSSVATAAAPPTRMLLLAPIWAASAGRDPFYGRLVPAWSCSSFSWLTDTIEQRQSEENLVARWSTLWRFGATLSPLHPDYAHCQGQIFSPRQQEGELELKVLLFAHS